ncbi:MAG TPA: primase-helicase zinc-binding domain-containing protein, partial [Bradyrhizobium sp.]|nr:primase-helicase zinc-binding domain-containing protein [Bradyrhizobium sp.]
MTTLPANLAALRDEAMRISCISWALQCRWAIARAGIDRAGPCPVCGGTDRFSIHTTKNTFNCRKCGIAGVGVIDLVMRTQDVEFVAACEIITGRKASEPIDEQRAAENRRAAELAEAKRVREAEQYRLAARKDGFAIFEAAQPVIHGQASVVWDYLARRGIRLEAAIAAGCDPFRLRLWVIEAHPWREKQGSTYATLHTGPAMIAVLRRPESVA